MDKLYTELLERFYHQNNVYVSLDLGGTSSIQLQGATVYSSKEEGFLLSNSEGEIIVSFYKHDISSIVVDNGTYIITFKASKDQSISKIQVY